MNLESILSWFAGNGRYMSLYHCMDHDVLWIAITVSLELAVVAGYLLIARHWAQNQRRLQNKVARNALGSMRNIFVFCAICGYAFIPIKMVWPAWRLYDLFLVVLVYFTWRYAWGARELRVIYSELDRSEQLAVDLRITREESQRKSHFLNALSHDLRNPLYGLSLQAEVAEMSLKGGDPDAVRQAIANIKLGAQETSEMLNGFLELAKLDWAHDPLQPTTFNARWLAEKMRHMHDGMAREKQIRLDVEGPDDLHLTTDRVKLERVLGNLVSNAIKFTQHGFVRLHFEPANQGVCFHVTDSGVGIPVEHHAKLFDEFYQVHNHERDRRKGFGLGLPITRRLVQQMGGQIDVASTLGRGSCFSVWVPDLQQQQLDPAGQAGSPGALTPCSNGQSHSALAHRSVRTTNP